MSIESEDDLKAMRHIGKIVRKVLSAMIRHVVEGITTAELDAIGAEMLEQHDARSAPQHEYGFPAATCISLNDEAVHGIPGPRVIRAGDVVKIDVEAECNGYVADAARTVIASSSAPHAHRLAQYARSAFWQAMEAATAGNHTRDIGRAVEREVRRGGYSIIPQLCGHGVGRKAHEPPSVPNYDAPMFNDRLTCGLVITVEPIIAAGSGQIFKCDDGWTIRTADHSMVAHYEETIVITDDRPIILTAA